MKAASAIRVLLVDDYQAVLDGLQRMLALDRRIRVVGMARSGWEAVAKAVSLAPDVVTMDLRMRGMDGIAATREIKQRMPQVGVLALTMYGDEMIPQAFEAGVSGYVLKDSTFEDIVDAVHKVHGGLRRNEGTRA